MKIGDVMNEEVASCSVNDSCQEAARAMRDRNVGFVVVKDHSSGKVAGVVTDRDICMAAEVKRKKLSDIPIKITMSKKVYSCRMDSELEAAHQVMRRHHVRRLPVINADGALVGVVSLSDLALGAREAAPLSLGPDVETTLARFSNLLEAPAGPRSRREPIARA